MRERVISQGSLRMDRQELAELLTATFVAELDERVQSLERDLLAIEKRPPPGVRSELLKALFRSAHSLKGAARSVSASVIEASCHCMEEVLTSVRDGRLSREPQLCALLFSTVDALQDAGARLREQRDLQGSPLKAVLPQLDQIAKEGSLAAPGTDVSSSVQPVSSASAPTAGPPSAEF